MRIEMNDPAPVFRWPDTEGNPVSITAYQGRSVMVSFYRYASCPFCNLRMAELRRISNSFQQRGLDMIAVFQSPADRIRVYAGRQHAGFPVLPDPERQLYRLYGLEVSWSGMAKAFVRRFPAMIKAFAKGYLPGTVEGEIHRLPADFIIDPQGRVAVAYYGSDIGDHLPIDRIDEWLSQQTAGG